MKFNFILVFGILLIPMVSCNKDESSFYETESNLQIKIMMITDELTTDKSGTEDFHFSGEGTYSGIKLINFENHLYQIQNIKAHAEPVLSLSEIIHDGEFYSLTLQWGYKGAAENEYRMQESIDVLLFEHQVEEGKLIIELDNALVQLINNLDKNPDNSINVILTGTSNFKFNGTANLEIPVIVESKTMNVRFELF